MAAGARPGTRNQEPGTRSQEPGTKDQEPETRNQGPGKEQQQCCLCQARLGRLQQPLHIPLQI